MQKEKTLVELCKIEEDTYLFSNFSHEDALTLGTEIITQSKNHEGSLAVEITVNDLAVFRYFPTGTSKGHERMLRSKRRMVETIEMSSLHAFALLQESNEKLLEDWHLSPLEFAAVGGGFPIRNTSKALIGAICVSGFSHFDDHTILVSSIHNFLNI